MQRFNYIHSFLQNPLKEMKINREFKYLLRAKRSEAKRARKRALSHVVVDEFHLQNLKAAITQKLSILEVWCIEQITLLFIHGFTHI